MSPTALAWGRTTHVGSQAQTYIPGMRSRPRDTAPASWAQYEMVLDEMDGAARFRAAIDLSDAVREIRLTGIRSRHPELSRQEAVARLVAQEYGVELPRRK